jgi:hypothetical protein
MGEEVREALPEGLSDAQAGMLLALAHQVVGEALARGRSEACCHRLRVSALRLAPRPHRKACVLLRLDDRVRLLAQTLVWIVR